MVEYVRSDGKKRTLAGNVGLGFFAFSFVLIFIAFCTSSWLISDRRITGASLERLGLWSHCFKSFRDPNKPNQIFVGCRWIYDRYTVGYYNLTGFMMVTQVFFTLCFLSSLICAILGLLYFFGFSPKEKRFRMFLLFNASVSMIGGLCGGIAVTVFAIFGNRNDWTPGHEYNFFGYSFVLACVGSVGLIVSSIFYFTDWYNQRRKSDQKSQYHVKFKTNQESEV